jgi:hypothetical protein
MAATSIGAWAVNLSCDAQGLMNGLQAGEKGVAGFAQNTVAALKGVSSQTANLFSAMTRLNVGQQLQPLLNIGKSIGGLISSLATGNIAGSAAAFVGVGVSLVSFASASMDAIAVQERLGRQIGITAQETAGLQALASRANLAPESITQALSMWPLQLAHIRQEIDSGHSDGPMSIALARMGIDARSFIELDLPTQLSAMAGGLQSIGSQSIRNETSTKRFVGF